ncbi:MAG: energy-coupling factor ABC transporter ATP-binding protein, partial [Candidatus Heimdallarchaeota archaeon]|nr:energy-coupling factor ABC transporter ATP-binding protein [Candidatus Heimdallarchaeota archaeon]
LITPQMGDVYINGISVKENSKKSFHTEVGLLFENPEDQLYYPIVADDIAFGPRNLKLNKKEIYRRVIQSSKELNILHLMERETSTLSFGEKTLVALAGMLAMNTKIILMDSPEIGLDFWSKPILIRLLERLKLNHTIVMCTNDTSLLKRADKILLLWKGKIREEFVDYREFRSSLSKKGQDK